VPSRTRFTRVGDLSEGGSAGVGEELAVDGVGDPSFELSWSSRYGKPLFAAVS
jgi:hypothetical protein